MKLSFQQIKDITAGAIKIWQEDSCVYFSKCSEKQIDAWHNLETALGERAKTTTGIRLDFHTNSSRFGFTASKGKKFEIYINGILSHNITADDLINGTYSITLDTSIKNTRVTFILPSHEVGALSSVEIEDGAAIIPHTFGKKILFIGDSITQGWDSGYDSLSFAQRFSRYFNADCVIQGVGGGFFEQSIIDPELNYDPDIIIVALGTNDWGKTSLNQLEKNIDAFFKKLTVVYNGKPIVAISPIWRADNHISKDNITFWEVCDLVKSQVKKHELILVDGEKMVPHLPCFFADEILHPNALGFSFYTENLIKEIGYLM